MSRIIIDPKVYDRKIFSSIFNRSINQIESFDDGLFGISCFSKVKNTIKNISQFEELNESNLHYKKNGDFSLKYSAFVDLLPIKKLIDYQIRIYDKKKDEHEKVQIKLNWLIEYYNSILKIMVDNVTQDFYINLYKELVLCEGSIFKK